MKRWQMIKMQIRSLEKQRDDVDKQIKELREELLEGFCKKEKDHNWTTVSRGFLYDIVECDKCGQTGSA